MLPRLFWQTHVQRRGGRRPTRRSNGGDANGPERERVLPCYSLLSRCKHRRAAAVAAAITASPAVFPVALSHSSYLSLSSPHTVAHAYIRAQCRSSFASTQAIRPQQTAPNNGAVCLCRQRPREPAPTCEGKWAARRERAALHVNRASEEKLYGPLAQGQFPFYALNASPAPPKGTSKGGGPNRNGSPEFSSPDQNSSCGLAVGSRTKKKPGSAAGAAAK